MNKKNSNCLCVSKNLIAFKQVVVEDNFLISLESPNIDTISRFNGDTEILGSSIIKTATGVSLEGYKLTGSKAIIDSILYIDIEYIAKNSVQSVHALRLEIPFKDCIVISNKYNEFTKLFYSSFLEGLTVIKGDDRKIYVSANILITVEEN
ncbi:MAG: hypothetical protein ACRCWM_07755 [Sarcina sp.]|uniref:hypothetical protein n=1 Tax=Clostridium sp. TaxID=1506 RepID=UPI003F2FC817